METLKNTPRYTWEELLAHDIVDDVLGVNDAETESECD